MSWISEFTKGLWKENPIFRLVLGLCPTLAVTTSVENGLGMGLAATFVLIGSNIVISMLRKIIPRQVRIPCFIVVIASFVTIIDMILHAYAFQLWKSLGLFIPLIVVNCIILGRAEAFASRYPVSHSMADGLGMGVGFTLSLMLIGGIREILASGAIVFTTFAQFSLNIFGAGYEPFLIMILPPGAFITLGLLMGLMNRLSEERA